MYVSQINNFFKFKISCGFSIPTKKHLINFILKKKYLMYEVNFYFRKISIKRDCGFVVEDGNRLLTL